MKAPGFVEAPVRHLRHVIGLLGALLDPRVHRGHSIAERRGEAGFAGPFPHRRLGDAEQINQFQQGHCHHRDRTDSPDPIGAVRAT